MKHFQRYTEFVNEHAVAQAVENVNEGQSTIGITTHGDAIIDGIDDLKADLDKAKIKYKFNRLSMTLSVFNMDKRFFKKAKKIIDDSGFGILLAKESVINEKKAGFVAIYKVMGQEFKFGPLKTDDKKSIMAMLSSAIQGGFQLVRVVPADQVEESVHEGYSNEERMKLADKGFALSDGSYPIKNLEDLKNAIQAYGRAKDQAKAAKFIAKRAKALGAEDLIPNTDDFQKSLDESILFYTNAINEGDFDFLEDDFKEVIAGYAEDFTAEDIVKDGKKLEAFLIKELKKTMKEMTQHAKDEIKSGDPGSEGFSYDSNLK